MIITIDGPVASGKSSVARELAKRLNIYYLHTGLFYRAIAYIIRERLSKERGHEISDADLVTHMQAITPEQLAFVKELAYDYDGEQGHVFFQGQDITEHLHGSVLDHSASIVSANEHVRASVLDAQRSVASEHDIVADGRDCGSVVFPDAEHKFFLTASVVVRAQRLILDERRQVADADLEKVKQEIEVRDRRDKERAIAPLIIPDKAIVIDSSKLSFSQTIDRFLSHIENIFAA